MARKKKNGYYGDCGTAPEVGISGFYRVNIVDPDGTVKGDSGWHKNVISNLGLANYIAYSFAPTGGSTGLVPAYMQLGSLASSHASNLVAVTGQYATGSAASIGSTAHTTRAAQSDGHTVRFYATFVSNSLVTSGTSSIAGIGLYNAVSVSSAMCAGTFAGSTLGSNQAVNCSYDIVFSATSTT